MAKERSPQLIGDRERALPTKETSVTCHAIITTISDRAHETSKSLTMLLCFYFGAKLLGKMRIGRESVGMTILLFNYVSRVNFDGTLDKIILNLTGEISEFI